MKEWNRFDIDIQEVLCKKYNIQITDFKTASDIKAAKRKARRDSVVKTMVGLGEIGGVILAQSLDAWKKFNDQPKPKRRKKRKKYTSRHL